MYFGVFFQERTSLLAFFSLTNLNLVFGNLQCFDFFAFLGKKIWAKHQDALPKSRFCCRGYFDKQKMLLNYIEVVEWFVVGNEVALSAYGVVHCRIARGF